QFKIPSSVGVESVTICRSTGFLASKGCPQKVNIMIPVGQAPDSACPWHGGDILSARADPNAPQLILTPDDDGIRHDWQLEDEWSNSDTQTAEMFLPLPPPNIDLSPLPSPNLEPYVYDPAPVNDIEKRYQDLLDQYNIR
ncbi:MAG: penicillin-binding protein, partial [Synergistaceae bacterium]|nr:penicillin-binding protein [Synergistaceae bacterium]